MLFVSKTTEGYSSHSTSETSESLAWNYNNILQARSSTYSEQLEIVENSVHCTSFNNHPKTLNFSLSKYRTIGLCVSDLDLNSRTLVS